MNMFDGDDPFGGAGGGGLFAQLAQGFAGGGYGPQRRQARSYDEYMKAYSVAMLPGRERENLSYGGKIIMPPSALANLSNLDIESPWMFKLSNPTNPAASTHAGVLEFIAEEGCVHLPFWMMKTLQLNEGDPIRIAGAELPKGKFVKLQAQSIHFLDISDHKAVLEHALRNFTTLTQGDMIQIVYNSIVHDLLVIEAVPGGEGISVIDTDLEVDFAAPKGYKEPERPKAAPPPTMAEKLKIDLASSTPGSSRPSSALSGAFAGNSTGETSVSKGGDAWESFKGKGETLNGRKTKGRGVTHRAIENMMEGSKVYRTDKKRIVTNDTLDNGAPAPAPLSLPHGKLFFGFRHVPYSKPVKQDSDGGGSGGGSGGSGSSTSFAGGGATLSGRPSAVSTSSSSAKGKEKAKDAGKAQDEVKWGTGQTLNTPSSRRVANDGPVGAGGARVPRAPVRNTRAAQKQKERSPSPPDWGVSDDEDVIYVDSD